MKLHSLLWVVVMGCLPVSLDAQPVDDRGAETPRESEQEENAEVEKAAEEVAAAKKELAARVRAIKIANEARLNAAKAAQQPIVDFAPAPNVQQWRLAGRPNIATNQATYSRRLELTIADMKRVCDLTDQQTHKLKLAAKGAVAQLVEKKAPPAPAAPQEVAVEIHAFDVAPAVAGVNGDFVTVVSPSQANPLNGKFWKAAVSKVLTEDQKKQYKETVANRDKQLRKAIVDLAIAKLDQDLLLSDQQRNALRQKIAEKKTAPQADQGFRIMGHDSAGLGEKDLQPILTTSQLAEWKSMHQPQPQAFAPVFVAPAARVMVKPKHKP